MAVVGGSSSSAGNVGELVVALEQATLMAQQLPTAADPSHLHHIYSSLHAAHLRLSSFLSHSIPPPPPPAPENSVSSAVAADDIDDDDSPMLLGGDDGRSWKNEIEEVGERMRDGLFIQNKRPKRSLSPSAADNHQQRSMGYYESRVSSDYDPHRTKSRALDLVFQFHG